MREMQDVWRQLEDSDHPPPNAPSLGYRGCTLDCGTRKKWFAYGGVVAHGGTYKRDPERKFERLLLESAPAGLLPPDILRAVR